MGNKIECVLIIMALSYSTFIHAQTSTPCPEQIGLVASQVENSIGPIAEKMQSELCDSIEVEGRILMLDDNSRKDAERIQSMLRNALFLECKKNTTDFISIFEYSQNGLNLTIYVTASSMDGIEQNGNGELEKVTFNGKTLPAKYRYSSGDFISHDYTGVQLGSLYADNLKIYQEAIQQSKSEVALGINEQREVILNGFKLQVNLRGDDYAYAGETSEGTAFVADYERNGEIHQGTVGWRYQELKRENGNQFKKHVDLIVSGVVLDHKQNSIVGAGFGVRAGAEFQKCLNDEGTSRICYVADGSISLFGGFGSGAVTVNAGTGVSLQQDLNSDQTSYLYVNGMIRGQFAAAAMEGDGESAVGTAGYGFGYAPSVALGLAY